MSGLLVESFWTGETGRALRGAPEAQVLACYLMSSPHATLLGCYPFTPTLAEQETGLSVEDVTRECVRLEALGFATYDETMGYVFVRELARFRLHLPPRAALPVTDHRRTALQRLWEELPWSRLLPLVHERYGRAFGLKRRSPPPATARPRPPSTPMARGWAFIGTRVRVPQPLHEELEARVGTHFDLVRWYRAVDADLAVPVPVATKWYDYWKARFEADVAPTVAGARDPKAIYAAMHARERAHVRGAPVNYVRVTRGDDS
jgi:hypothetical protein